MSIHPGSSESRIGLELGWHKSGFGFHISHQPDQTSSDNFCTFPGALCLEEVIVYFRWESPVLILREMLHTGNHEAVDLKDQFWDPLDEEEAR